MVVVSYAPMPLGSFGSTSVVLLVLLDAEPLGVLSGTIVEVDEERLKVFARGARCVSLSSAGGLDSQSPR